MSDETIEEKLTAILELLRPRKAQVTPDEWEDVTGEVFQSLVPGNWHYQQHDCIGIDESCFRLRKIDGLHNGPAFIIERKKS